VRRDEVRSRDSLAFRECNLPSAADWRARHANATMAIVSLANF
jgi:hypothetical protein